ncbi:hypothetical protein GCM10022278_26030 [Allohahella marinimesophila]|uniref:Uncharacterized protein n=1 Tax=Allohahella marinimesophila TaxID=1054972 RepID=A0ABP7PKA5_9GAMM
MQNGFDRYASLFWFEPLNPEGALLTALSQTTRQEKHSDE